MAMANGIMFVSRGTHYLLQWWHMETVPKPSVSASLDGMQVHRERPLNNLVYYRRIFRDVTVYVLLH